jgi:hypothetical protein
MCPELSPHMSPTSVQILQVIQANAGIFEIQGPQIIFFFFFFKKKKKKKSGLELLPPISGQRQLLSKPHPPCSGYSRRGGQK